MSLLLHHLEHAPAVQGAEMLGEVHGDQLYVPGLAQRIKQRWEVLGGEEVADALQALEEVGCRGGCGRQRRLWVHTFSFTTEGR